MNYEQKIKLLEVMIDELDVDNSELLKKVVSTIITYSAIDKQEVVNLLEDEIRRGDD